MKNIGAHWLSMLNASKQHLVARKGGRGCLDNSYIDKRGKIDQRRGPEHGPKAKNWGLGFSKSVRTSLGTVATPLTIPSLGAHPWE